MVDVAALRRAAPDATSGRILQPRVGAAREGARKAAVTPDVREIEARVREASSFLDQSRMTVTITCSSGGGAFGACGSWQEGDYVRVDVDYSYPFITPLPSFVGMGSTLELHSRSETRFEGV